MCVWTQTYQHISLHTHQHARMHPYLQSHGGTRIHTHTHTHTHKCVAHQRPHPTPPQTWMAMMQLVTTTSLGGAGRGVGGGERPCTTSGGGAEANLVQLLHVYCFTTHFYCTCYCTGVVRQARRALSAAAAVHAGLTASQQMRGTHQALARASSRAGRRDRLI